MDQVLQALGIDTNGVRYDDLRDDELKTLYGWIEAAQREELTISKIIENISAMKEAVTNKLIETPETVRVCFFFVVPNRQSILLRARLQNYSLLETMLRAPERAKQSIQSSLDTLKG